MLETARALKDTFAKKRAALSEGINLDEFLTTQDFAVEREPFPHIVVDNVFRPEFYKALERYFATNLEKGLSETADEMRFHPFLELQKMGKEWEYDGYVYVPLADDDSVLKPFLSLEWNLLFSRLFDQPADWSTSLALHHHPPGNRTGFVHNDYAAKHFSMGNQLANGVIYREVPNRQSNIPTFTTMRVIALLFYIGNESVSGADGGGTGLYAKKGLAPVKVVEPRANRLLAFQISPQSFHAFQTNHTERNSITQWLHINRAWCQKRYGHV